MGWPLEARRMLRRVWVVAIMAQSYGWMGAGTSGARRRQPRPTVLDNFMGVCCSRAARRLGAIASILVEAAACAWPAQQAQRSDAADEIRNSFWTCIQ